MAICCNKDRNTNFCPECGKAIKESTLHQILRYVRGKLSEATKRRDRARVDLARAEALTAKDFSAEWHWRDQWRSAKELDIAAHTKSIATAERGMAMWQDWEEALIKAIDGD